MLLPENERNGKTEGDVTSTKREKRNGDVTSTKREKRKDRRRCYFHKTRETERQMAMLLPQNERNGKTDGDVTSTKREKRKDRRQCYLHKTRETERQTAMLLPHNKSTKPRQNKKQDRVSFSCNKRSMYIFHCQQPAYQHNINCKH